MKYLKSADDVHKTFKEDLRNLFSNNDAFANAFTYEKMTGKVKFDNSDGTGMITLLVTDYSEMHRVIKLPL